MNANSLAAYRKIGEHLDSHHYEIYEALLGNGPGNAWNISQSPYCSLTEAQTFRRLSEMVRAGWIQKLDWDTQTPTGCWASTYWVKE